MSLGFPVGAQWIANDFFVASTDPWTSTTLTINGKKQFPNLDWAQLRKNQTTQALAAQDYLINIGLLYEQGELLEPNFGPKVNTTTRAAFMFPFPGTAGLTDAVGQYLSASCDQSQRFKEDWLAIDDLPPNNDLYHVVAHELFHGIQAQYPFARTASGAKNCYMKRWVDEGMADAAGFFLLERKLSGGVPKNDPDFYGMRPYDIPLYEHPAWEEAPFLKRFGFPNTKDGKSDANENFSYRTSSFWRFLMDRWGNYLDEYDLGRFDALSYPFMKRTGPEKNPPTSYPAHKRWMKWVVEGTNKYWAYNFFHMYPEFLTEFAAWPGTKYPNQKPDTWLKDAFGGCDHPTRKSAKPKPVILSSKNTSDTIRLEPVIDGIMGIQPKALYPLAGRCIQVTVKPKKEIPFKLEITVETKKPEEADQLVLGFAREEQGNKPPHDDCYTHARREGYAKHDSISCLYFARTLEVSTPKGIRYQRTFRVAPREFQQSIPVTLTFILVNVDPEDPGNTIGMQNLDVTVSLRMFDGKTQKWTRFDLPESFKLDQLPDPTIPRRQALYGIRKKSAVSTGYSMGLTPIQVTALDDVGKKKETYAISPMEPIAFGQTGPFKAMVMEGGTVGMPTGTIGAIGSQFCAPDSQPGNIGTIKRSDDEILEISIDTPLCELSLANFAACEDGCPVVDHFQGKLSLPFGWRYFAENKVEDLVTPGVLLDIDRYHHEVFGTPLQGLSGGGSDGSSGSGTGDGGGSGGGNNGGDPDSGGSSSSTSTSSIAINFQPTNVSVPTGYQKDDGSIYTGTRGYGWTTPVNTQDRSVQADQRLDTFILFNTGTTVTWNHDLSNGDYLVSLSSGDPSFAQGPHDIRVEGTPVIKNQTTGKNQFLTITDHLVTVDDGQLTVQLTRTDSSTTLLNYLIITPAGSSGRTNPKGGSIRTPPCDCSCKGYKKHREKLKEIKSSEIPDFNKLSQMLQCDQQCKKPFRDCRRAQKRR